MSWSTLPPHIRDIAERELTKPQLEAWKLELAGLSQRRIAYALTISRGAVKDRIENAYLTLRKHGIDQDKFGNWTRKDAA